MPVDRRQELRWPLDGTLALWRLGVPRRAQGVGHAAEGERTHLARGIELPYAHRGAQPVLAQPAFHGSDPTVPCRSDDKDDVPIYGTDDIAGKGLALVDVLASEQGPLALSELARRARQPRSTSHRLLRTLGEFGLVAQRDDGRYALGQRLVDLGRRAVLNADLREIARPRLRRLRDLTGETAHLGVVLGDEVVYLEKVESEHAVRMASEIGGRNPLHCTALGKAILAHGSPELCDRVLRAGRLASRTEHTLTNAAALAEDLRLVRSRGFSLDDEESELDLRCIGAPVLDAEGRAVAAVSVSGPTTRVTDENVDRFAALVIAAARAIGRSLGHVDAPAVP